MKWRSCTAGSSASSMSRTGCVRSWCCRPTEPRAGATQAQPARAALDSARRVVADSPSTQSPHRLHRRVEREGHSTCHHRSWSLPVMQRLLPLLKIGAILFLTVLLLLPMERIRGLIRERQALRDQVVEEVARSDAYAQTLAGPLLIVPFTRTLREQEPGRDG